MSDTVHEDKFVDFVIDEAKRQTGKNFIIDSDEGREMPNPPDGMEVSDISGWLLTDDQLKTTPHRFREERVLLFERDDIEYVFARWEDTPEGLKINFD